HDYEFFTPGLDVTVDCRTGADKRRIHCIAKKRFDGGWAGVEGDPVDPHADSFFKRTGRPPVQSLSVRDVGKVTEPEFLGCAVGSPNASDHYEYDDQEQMFLQDPLHAAFFYCSPGPRL